MNGRTSRKKTTKGRSLCVEWKDGTLHHGKNYHKVAEYAVAMNLVEEPAFEWWVPFRLVPDPGVSLEVANSNAKSEGIQIYCYK